jgi:pilus assembly protein Flp/PilA
MRRKLIKFIENQSGATAIEYALIGALVSVAIILGATSLGNALRAMYISVDTMVEGAG